MTLRGNRFIIDIINGKEIPIASLKKIRFRTFFIFKAGQSYSVIIHTPLHFGTDFGTFGQTLGHFNKSWIEH